MSRRKSPEALKKITMNINASDYERMQALYPKVGATVAIRALVHAHVSKVTAKAAAMVESVVSDIDAEDLNVELEGE